MTGAIRTHVDPLSLKALGARVDLVFGGSGCESVARAVREAWSRCVTVAVGTPTATLEVVVDDDPNVVTGALVNGAVAGDSLAGVMDTLSRRVTLAAIDARAGELIMLHAAGLADPTTGRTVALVAPSGTGKTTSSRLLARRWGYVSDETVGIASDLEVVAYPKPLSVIVDDSAYKEQLSPDALGLIIAPEPLRLHRVCILERDGSADLRIEQVSTARAIARLATESSYLSRIPRPLHRLADALTACGGLQVLHYADTEQLPEVIEALLKED